MDRETFNAVKFIQDAYGYTEKAAITLVTEYHAQNKIKDLFDFVKAKQSSDQRL